ncbi:hypothetical protein [Leifsonia shinshuensis]
MTTTPLTRRTLVGAAAWTAPAIALSTASPAHAASPVGVIAFVDADDLIGSGYTADLVVQLTPPTGDPVPANLAVAYSSPGVVDGPTLVATGGKNLVTIPVTGRDVNRSTVITVSAPGYLPATTTLRVTFDDGAFFMARNAPFGVRHSANTLNPTTSSGIRGTAADGTIVDTWTGGWLYRSTLASNTFTPTGTLFGGSFDDPGTIVGTIAWRLEVVTTGAPNLRWQQRNGFAFSGRALGDTYQEGVTRSGAGLGVMNVVPAVRATLSSASNPGGSAFFTWSFPRFPKYRALWTIQY